MNPLEKSDKKTGTGFRDRMQTGTGFRDRMQTGTGYEKPGSVTRKRDRIFGTGSTYGTRGLRTSGLRTRIFLFIAKTNAIGDLAGKEPSGGKRTKNYNLHQEGQQCSRDSCSVSSGVSTRGAGDSREACAC